MNDMFIDPFTGAAPRSGYGATPMQTSQMSSGGDNGRSPYGNDANIEHLNRMKEQGTADVYDSIYRQNESSDLVGGDTFVGDDGLNYTVGYDVGQVDPALANAVQRNKINEVRSTGSAIGSMIGNTLQDSLLGRVFEGVTGVAPFNSNDAPAGSLSNADVNDGRFANIIGYEQENARAQSDAALRQQIDAYNQRGDMYPSQIESGLLNGTPLASSNIVDLSAARQAEDLAAQQRADKIKADAQAAATLKKAADAAKKAAAKKAADAAAAKAAQVKRRNDRGPEAGRNSSGNGFGASSKSGSTKSGQTDYGFF